MKLIKINEKHFIIVDSSEINIGDWIFYPVTKAILRWDGNMPLRHEDLKITHSTEPLNKIFNDWFDVQIISLSEIEEAVYSVEKMANLHAVQSGCEYKEDLVRISKAYQTGFKAHQELVKDKLFTVEKAIQILEEESYGQGSINRDEYKSRVISKLESFLPKTEWDVKFDKDKLILA